MKLLERHEVDDVKWNATISASLQGLPYGFTWYLDCVCKNWKAFVANDYSAVMPIAVGKKFLVSYCYQPFFCQQLGIFFTRKNETLFQEWLHELRQLFLFTDYHFNFTNEFQDAPDLKWKTNLILDLNTAYENLHSQFSQNTRRNISKAKKADYIFTVHRRAEDRLSFYLEHTASRDKNFKPNDQQLLKQLVQELEARELLMWFDCSTTGKRVATAGVVVGGSRYVHLLPATGPDGRDTGAMHFLTSKILEHFSNTKTVYDFEGSSVPSIARFYKGFGAQEELFAGLLVKRKIFRNRGNSD